jgi:hypothetical protein
LGRRRSTAELASGGGGRSRRRSTAEPASGGGGRSQRRSTAELASGGGGQSRRGAATRAPAGRKRVERGEVVPGREWARSCQAGSWGRPPARSGLGTLPAARAGGGGGATRGGCGEGAGEAWPAGGGGWPAAEGLRRRSWGDAGGGWDLGKNRFFFILFRYLGFFLIQRHVGPSPCQQIMPPQLLQIGPTCQFPH